MINLGWLHAIDLHTYNAMKNAAIARHHIWNILFEVRNDDLTDTWHQKVLDLWYPL